MPSSVRRVRLVPIRGLLVAMAFAWCAQMGRAAQFELLQVIPELPLKDGTTLHNVTFVSVGISSITGKWDGGRGSIALALLPDEVRADLAPVAARKSAPPPPVARDEAEATSDTARLPTEIKLTNGFIMQQARVVSWQADAMTVRYVGGTVLVKFDNISPEQRMLFVTYKIEVFARQTRSDAARAAKSSAPGANPPSIAAAAGPASNDLKALIKAGINAHRLVIGMTQAEVEQAIGPPARTAMDPTAPNYAYWLYPGRGRNAQGAACDRIVGFDKGIMDGWKDN